MNTDVESELQRETLRLTEEIAAESVRDLFDAYGVKRLAPVPRVELPPLTYYASPGNVFVWIELETDERFRFGPPMQAIHEGSAVLF
jgi:hypothetical protein